MAVSLKAFNNYAEGNIKIVGENIPLGTYTLQRKDNIDNTWTTIKNNLNVDSVNFILYDNYTKYKVKYEYRLLGENFLDKLSTNTHTSNVTIVEKNQDYVILETTSQGTWRRGGYDIELPPGNYTLNCNLEHLKGTPVSGANFSRIARTDSRATYLTSQTFQGEINSFTLSETTSIWLFFALSWSNPNIDTVRLKFYDVFLTNQYITSNQIECIFDGVFLCDYKDIYNIVSELTFENYKRINISSATDTLGGKFPTIVKNNILDYDNGLLRCHINYNKSNDIDEIKQHEYINSFVEFINNGKPKIYKDFNYNFKLVYITNPLMQEYYKELGNMVSDFMYEFVEVGDENNFESFGLTNKLNLHKAKVITLLDWDDTLINKYIEKENEEITITETPARFGYTFTEWDVLVDNNDQKTLKALYQINTYTVIFKDWDGNILKTQNIEHNSSATAPSSPTRIGYTFKGWDKLFLNITHNLIINAVYEIMIFTVTFKNWDNSILNTQLVEYGGEAIAPSSPTRIGYTFMGWDNNFNHITEDLYINAEFLPKDINITYYYMGITWGVGKTFDQPYGELEFITKTGYTFIGWNLEQNGSGEFITEQTIVSTPNDHTLYAIFEINTYTVTFKDWDGSIIDVQLVEYGNSANEPNHPSRELYFFNGWNENFSNIVEDIVITAIYKHDENYTLIYWDGQSTSFNFTNTIQNTETAMILCDKYGIPYEPEISYKTTDTSIITPTFYAPTNDSHLLKIHSTRDYVLGRSHFTSPIADLHKIRKVFMSNNSYLLNTSFKNTAVEEVILNPNMTQLPANLFENSNLKTITIPQNITSISQQCFIYCSNLENVVFEDEISLEIINIWTFGFCSSLNNFTIPKSVKIIQHSILNSCINLEKVCFEKDTQIESIGDASFYNCPKLKTVIIESLTPPILGENVFGLTHNELKIYVPSQSVDAYKTATNWSAYAGRIFPIID